MNICGDREVYEGGTEGTEAAGTQCCPRERRCDLSLCDLQVRAVWRGTYGSHRTLYPFTPTPVVGRDYDYLWLWSLFPTITRLIFRVDLLHSVRLPILPIIPPSYIYIYL